jgi:excisionase family DNA binding protein
MKNDAGEEKPWCPLCQDHTVLIGVNKAARLVNMNPKTIYRYIQEGSVYAVKVAGKSYRVCRGCLLHPVTEKS